MEGEGEGDVLGKMEGRGREREVIVWREKRVGRDCCVVGKTCGEIVVWGGLPCGGKDMCCMEGYNSTSIGEYNILCLMEN